MAKYHELVEKYGDEIASIKELRQVYEQRVEEADALSVTDDEYEYQEFMIDDLAYSHSQDAYNEWIIALYELSQDVEAEYCDVPFNKPRKQGMKRFWELAELEPR